MNTLRRLAAGAAALLLAGALSPAGDTFDYVRVFEPAGKGSGTWGGKFAARPGEGPLVGLSIAADWWDGPGDPRAGDPKLSAMPGILYEVKKGEGPWIALPAADRDLRLTARTAAPADAKDLFGASPDGEWSVRQKAGGAYPRFLHVEFTCRGDPLLSKDLRVKDLTLPDLDPKPVVGRPYIADRIENRTLKAGDAVDAVVVVENCGARKTKEVDLDLLAAPAGKRQGARLGFAQVPPLEPGAVAELKISGKIPEDLAKEAGVFEIVAIVNPRGTEREVETFNNAAVRAFRYTPPEMKDSVPEDLRDR
jgi:hypothetical protein